MRRDHDSDCPGWQALEQRRVALEEVAELVAHRVGVEVDEDDVAGWMDADRQAMWELANACLVALKNHETGHIVGQMPRLEK